MSNVPSDKQTSEIGATGLAMLRIRLAVVVLDGGYLPSAIAHGYAANGWVEFEERARGNFERHGVKVVEVLCGERAARYCLEFGDVDAALFPLSNRRESHGLYGDGNNHVDVLV